MLVASLGDRYTRLTLPLPREGGFFQGHRETSPPHHDGMLLGHLPVRYLMLDDGLFVAHRSAAIDLPVGSRVLRIGSLPAAEATAVVAALPADAAHLGLLRECGPWQTPQGRGGGRSQTRAVPGRRRRIHPARSAQLGEFDPQGLRGGSAPVPVLRRRDRDPQDPCRRSRTPAAMRAFETFSRQIWGGSDGSSDPRTSRENSTRATLRSLRSPRPRSSEKGIPTLLRGAFDHVQRTRLAQVAERCLVHKTLANAVEIFDSVTFEEAMGMA